MSRTAVFPGTFDPVTLGHIDLVKRGLECFDQIIIAIGVNQDKKTMFSEDQRSNWIKTIFKNEDRVSVEAYKGLTIDFCNEHGASFILRGIRNTLDFEFEKTIAQVNQKLDPSVETVFLMCNPELSSISSTIVRDIIRNGGSANSLLPAEVQF